MKKKLFYFWAILLIGYSTATIYANEPDSAYLFAYATHKNSGKNGLHFAWSIDSKNWHSIGYEYPFLKSDFGTWGAQKRMLDPVLIQDKDGLWHCLFSLNENDAVLAHTSSSDLVYWKPQSYPYIVPEGNCSMIEVAYNAADKNYMISWLNLKDRNEQVYAVTTKNFKDYSSAQKVINSKRFKQRSNALIDGEEKIGSLHKVSWSLIDGLIKSYQLTDYKNKRNNEKTAEDPVRFANLKPVKANISIYPNQAKPISDLLIGIFFEDINYAADGGIYAELIQNRDFEYSSSDHKEWNAKTAWNLEGQDAVFTIDSSDPIHENNKYYAVLEIQKIGSKLNNEGFDGINLKKGEKYDFSLFAYNLDGKNKTLLVQLTDTKGKICGETSVKGISSGWKKYTSTIVVKETTENAHLELIPQTEGKIAMDMISLFPQKTFKGRKNGLRPDLAQTLADMKPRFVRFPGGCVAHGDGLENMYRWKNTIGSLESRKPQRNLWGYHQTAGLGYFEYFQFCEDIGAEPLPVLPAGVPCQNSSRGGHGQQCGIPMTEMQEYIQEVLDLIEWANGDPKQSRWAKMRAEEGHPKPFNMKYIGIGNEDLISDVFEERYAMICNAVKAKYPEISIVGTVGPFYEGSDYTEGWRIASEIKLDLVDEHYYNPPGWYIHNQDYYDRYDRNKSKVYLGEYAAHLPGRPNNIETALAEALHLANIERNGDIVSMTSYAPLLAKDKHTQWNPNLIYFNNNEVKPTVGYYVQKLYGNNSGDLYLSSTLDLSNRWDAVDKRVACSVVKDSKTSDVIVKLVNMLPVEVETTLSTENLNPLENEVMKTVITGKPDDRKAVPVETKISLENARNLVLPAYSFTVLKMSPLK